MSAVEHRFGPYGGQYVPETLMPALDELEQAWLAAPRRRRLPAPSSTTCCATIVGRPSPAVPRAAAERDRRASDLSQARGPQPHRRAQDQQRARPGAAGQADGQAPDHRRDRRRPARRGDRDRVRPARPRVRRVHGRRGHAPAGAQRAAHAPARRARCVPVEAGSRTLKDAMNEAHPRLGDQRRRPRTTSSARGRTGSVSGAGARFPGGDRRRGPRAGARARPAACPTRVVACVGGGSNAMGIFIAVRRPTRRCG